MNYGAGFGKGRFNSGRFGEGDIGYIKPIVRLEFGGRGEIEPSQLMPLSPYAAQAFPHLFDQPDCRIQTLTAERTFWEKVTILHALHHDERPMRNRMSRHYYDTYMLAQKGIADSALKDIALLERVVANKALMFADKRAAYDLAIPGSLRLLPQDNARTALKRDYDAMDEMFMTTAPSLDEIMETLTLLEHRINR